MDSTIGKTCESSLPRKLRQTSGRDHPRIQEREESGYGCLATALFISWHFTSGSADASKETFRSRMQRSFIRVTIHPLIYPTNTSWKHSGRRLCYSALIRTIQMSAKECELHFNC